MNEQIFYQVIHTKARELGLNPLLLISGIEGLYTFRGVQPNLINFGFLDSLILTIFALRIGDQFHTLAEQNLNSPDASLRLAATTELSELSSEDISYSANPYLQSFASILNGKSTIRKYHEKALEVAALEVEKVQLNYRNNSISSIMIDVCKNDLSGELNLSSLFHE